MILKTGAEWSRNFFLARPRRFGKTTAMKMLKAFFENTPKDTSVE